MDFTSTPQYEQLIIDFSSGVTAKGVWQHLIQGWSYKLGLTKASFLTHPAHRYVYAIMTRSFLGRADSTRVMGRQELLFPYSLMERHLIHICYVLADFIAH